MNRKFVFFGVGFAAALLIVQLLGEASHISLIIGLAAVAAVLTLLIKKYVKQAIIFIVGLAFAISWFCGYVYFDRTPEFNDEKIDFSAIASDYSFLNNQKSGSVCDLEITVLNGTKLDKTFNARVYFKDKELSLCPGDKVAGNGSFEIPKNDKDFKAFTYYKTRKIDAIGFCNDSIDVTKASKIPLKFLPKQIAHATKEQVLKLLPARSAGLVNAILLGDKTYFTLEDQNNFSATGLAHVVAVSGMHLAFLAGFIFLLLGRFRTIYLAIPILIFFSLIVGAPPSVVRALIMQIIVITAPVVQRETDSITSISVALVLILLLNPYSVLDIGFQLSFLATLGLVLYSTQLNSFFMRPFHLKSKIAKKIVSFFVSTFSASITAILFTTPVIIWNFKSVSLIAPICNLLMIWMVTGIFIVSIIGIISSFIFLPIGKVIMLPVALLSEIMLKCVDAFAKLPFAVAYIDNIYYILFIVYLYIIAVLFIKSEKKTFIIPTVCIVAVLIVTIAFNAISKPGNEFNGIRFSVLNIGQGASMLADYNDTCVMVDCGGSRSTSAGNIARNYIRKNGYNTLDALILTHMHSDHINGAKRLLEQIDVRELYLPAESRDEDACKNLIESANRRKTKIFYVSEETQVIKNGLALTIYPTSWFSDDNERGLVVLFKKDDFELIVTGDLERRSEKLLCQKYTLPDVEAYIVGHHGSNTSSCLEFINTILPEFAVISVGADNYYGHPHSETLSLFDDMGIEVHRTDLEGDIVFYSDELMKGAA